MHGPSFENQRHAMDDTSHEFRVMENSHLLHFVTAGIITVHFEIT